MSRRRNIGTGAGFTLIELVVTMLIVAVLVAVAVPSYRSYALRAHRTDAKAALLDLASLEERYFSTSNLYTNSAANLGYGTNAWPITIGSGYYQVNMPVIVLATAPTATTSGAPSTYQLTAVAIGTQTQDTACETFTVTSGGVRSATSSGGTDNTATCWN